MIRSSPSFSVGVADLGEGCMGRVLSKSKLIAYCALDTLALVRLWFAFSGSKLAIRE